MTDENTSNEPVEDRMIGLVQDALRKMGDPIKSLATSFGDEGVISHAVEKMTGILFNLSKDSFMIGMDEGAAAMDRSWKLALDNVEKRYSELNGGKGDSK